MAAPEFYGPYRVDKTLGQGGMGIVYRAVHAKTLEPVAVKVVSAAVGNHERFRRRFDAEIKTLMKLDHPNIVRLIGFGEEQGQLFYAMELVEGPTLQQHLKAIRRMPWADTIKMGIEIAGALKHAHDSGVIHRDLKPANLLVAPGGRIKLTDFGIAKLFGNVDVTAVGAVMGTADYMAPEQADGGPITPRTDLYALGSVMYACLAGRSPFGGRQITAVLNSLKNDPPPPLDLMNPDVPNELIELVNDLLAKAPVERPPTALAVGNRLRALQMGLKHREAQEQSSVADNVTLPEQVTEAPRAPKHRPPTFLTGSNPDAQTLSSEVDEGTLAPFNADAEGNAGPVTSHYRTVDASDRRRAASPITGAMFMKGTNQAYGGRWLVWCCC